MAKVRVDFFRRSGKWYTTEEMEWTGTNKDVNHAFAESLYNHLKYGIGIRHDYMVAVCLAPAHEFQYPVMMPVEDIYSYLKIDESFTSNEEHTEAPL